ncbi:MAG: helix-turn-helix transcriptional regulator [Clostridia bacterium]|nr:helix-turn-helix transcriptional regulator [Clostridia bacterium]
MANKTMGEIISTRRHELGMTQKDLADLLNITDKAVSKWERDVAYPDTGTIPKLAEILGVSVDELMGAKATQTPGHRGAGYLFDLILKAIPLAMGVAVTVTAILGELDLVSGFVMLGIGWICVGIYLLKKN